MEVLAVLKDEGGIYPITTTPTVIDLSQWRGGYVRLATLSDSDQLYVLPMTSETPPGTVHIADTSAEGGHGTATVPNVADVVPGGPSGTHRFIKSSHPFLWVRAVTGTPTLHVKPAGRPGEGT